MHALSIRLAGTVTFAAAFAGASMAQDMSCKSVRAILDARSTDYSQVGAAFSIVSDVYAALDDSNAKKGRTPIFSRMNDDGKRNTVAMATSRCEMHPGDTLRKSATEVYRGIEAVQKAMGLNP